VGHAVTFLSYNGGFIASSGVLSGHVELSSTLYHSNTLADLKGKHGSSGGPLVSNTQILGFFSKFAPSFSRPSTQQGFLLPKHYGDFKEATDYWVQTLVDQIYFTSVYSEFIPPSVYIDLEPHMNDPEYFKLNDSTPINSTLLASSIMSLS